MFTHLRIVPVSDDVENCRVVICFGDGLANNFVIYQVEEVNDTMLELSNNARYDFNWHSEL